MMQKSTVGGWVKGLGLVLSLLSLAGCLSMSSGKPSGPWHEAYQPIDHPDSEAFVAESLQRAVQQFGEPVVPVNQILLRRSLKTEAARRYHIAENFSLTECADETNGVFVIYMAVDPDHRNYYALLGHECAHLINARITDWYMEGFATVFSEQACKAAGKEWGDWKRHFMRSRREPYALSYRMLLELSAAFPDHYDELLSFTAPAVKRAGWLRIDIDAWLAELSDADYQTALEIIAPFAPALQKQVSSQYEFSTPEALK